MENMVLVLVMNLYISRLMNIIYTVAPYIQIHDTRRQNTSTCRQTDRSINVSIEI